MPERVSGTALVVAGSVVFLACCATLVGLYALAPNRPDIGPLFAGIPGALAFLVTLTVAGRQRQHGAQLAKISHQTNGVLTERIESAVASALAAHAVEVPAQRSRAHTRTAASAGGK